MHRGGQGEEARRTNPEVVVRYDIVLAGVGGQGVLTVGALLAHAADRGGLQVKQSEIHGMSQRGGSVVAGVRISDEPIRSSLIALGSADLVLGLEPLEALRSADHLSSTGRLITSIDPVTNIEGYPDLAAIRAAVLGIDGSILVEAKALARAAGSIRATNVVMLGAASASLPLPDIDLRATIEDAFASKGHRIVETNLRALAAGQSAATPV
jgi:indolepyruvate ferredoxin oxidoreductase beta subunit